MLASSNIYTRLYISLKSPYITIILQLKQLQYNNTNEYRMIKHPASIRYCIFLSLLSLVKPSDLEIRISSSTYNRITVLSIIYSRTYLSLYYIYLKSPIVSTFEIFLEIVRDHIIYIALFLDYIKPLSHIYLILSWLLQVAIKQKQQQHNKEDKTTTNLWVIK